MEMASEMWMKKLNYILEKENWGMEIVGEIEFGKLEKSEKISKNSNPAHKFWTRERSYSNPLFY